MTAQFWPETNAGGVRDIDSAHECLHFALEGLFVCPQACPCEEVSYPDKIEGVERFLQRKFRLEEKLMEDSGYPGLFPHRIEHISYLRRLHTLWQNIEADTAGAAALHDLLIEWIVDHVNLFDAEFGRFLASQRGHAGVLGPKADDIPTSSRRTPPCRGAS